MRDVSAARPGRGSASETKITSAAATTPQRMQSPGANIGRAAQRARVPNPWTGQYGRFVNSAIHTPTAIPTGTDASLTMITGVSVIHRW
jgi:hypothetical protein